MPPQAERADRCRGHHPATDGVHSLLCQNGARRGLSSFGESRVPVTGHAQVGVELGTGPARLLQESDSMHV